MSQVAPEENRHLRHLHRRSSSRWRPPSGPINNPLAGVFKGRSDRVKGSRMIQPNHMFEVPRYELGNRHRFKDNSITTTKYSLLTFIPLNILHQFLTKYANLYFLLIAVINFIPAFGAFNPFLALIPITFVLSTTLIKDGVEDLRRWRFDKQINSKTCHVWDRENARFRKTDWRYILVGDFVHISNEQDVPADILFLRSSDPNGICYVETSNLDGETSLKQRFVPKRYLDFSDENSGFEPPDFRDTILCEKPDKSIYKIRAKIEHASGSYDAVLSENMLLRGSRVKNTTFVEGVVMYAGHDTKIMMNNGRAPKKQSKIEKKTNLYIIICFIILVVMVILGMLLSVFWVSDHKPDRAPYMLSNTPSPAIDGLISVGSFIICYQVIVPISLYITVEIIKAAQIYFISQDIEIYDENSDRAIDCRSLSIPEELGTVTHVLSDKTGTLTENVMIFRCCAVDDADYGGEFDPAMVDPSNPVQSLSLMTRISDDWDNDAVLRHFFLNILINNSVVVNKVPHEDAIELGIFDRGVYSIGNTEFYDVTLEEFEHKIEELSRSRYPSTPLRLEIRHQSSGELSTIHEESASSPNSTEHTVPPTPLSPRSVAEQTTSPTTPLKRVTTLTRNLTNAVRNSLISPITSLLPNRKREDTLEAMTFNPYEAESPDELALIYGAHLYDFLLEDRASGSVTLQLPNNRRKKYSILLTLPFDARRKRMSVVIDTSKGPLLYTKGADSAIMNRLSPEMSDGEKKRLQHVQSNTEKYAARGLRTLCFAMRRLDKDEFALFEESYKFLMDDASEEREQMLSEKADELEVDMELLGVTGIEDKLQDGVSETIVALRRAGLQVWILTGDKLETAQNIATASGLFQENRPIRVVNGEDDMERAAEAEGCNLVLSTAAIKAVQEGNTYLIKALEKAKSVLCYRMTPAEKAIMVQSVKKHLTANVLAIGDGANDVPMIQAADVGIGVAGREGLQAVMACDFAIARFRFLKKLLLVHGHWSYDRLSLAFLYFLYKNTNCVFVLFFFQFFDCYSGAYNMDPLYSLLYPIVFTSLQPIVVGVLDQCEPKEKLLANPELYYVGREDRLYTTTRFVANIIDGIWQAGCIYFITHVTLLDSSAGLWMMSFYLANSMLFVNVFHLAFEVRYWNYPLIVLFGAFIALHFGFFFAYYAIAQPGWINDLPTTSVLEEAMSSFSFYASTLITVIVSLFPRFAAHVMANIFNDERERKIDSLKTTRSKRR